MKKFLSSAFLVILFLYCELASAKIFDHSMNDIQILRGNTYELGYKQRTIFTFEHSDSWKYGDNFIFVDRATARPTYTEVSPRLSLGKISGRNLSSEFIKDLLIATNVELYKINHQSHQNFLYGGAVDLNLPYFKFFQTNFYVRDNPNLPGKTLQVTLVWNLPITIESHKFLIEGFADFAGGEGKKYKPNQMVVPRFLWDVGNYWNYPKHVFTGVEWQYWHNKAGGKKTESVPQAMIKWVF